jgi:hypothetical protein
VHCADALDWLEKQPKLVGCSFITSLPDISELQGHLKQLSVPGYKAWMISTAQLVLSRCADDGVAIFFQTDIKVEGTWLDKGYLVQRAAEDTGHALLWHKVACRVAAGETTFNRPAYHHMLCFSKGVRTTTAAATPDVLPSAGSTTWARGMGTAACTAAVRFVLKHTTTRTVVDPFCGHGTVLAVANHLGLNAVGVEIGVRRAKQAEQLSAAGLKLNKGFTNQLKFKQQQQQQQQQQEEERQQQQQEEVRQRQRQQQEQQLQQDPGVSKDAEGQAASAPA